LIFLSPHVLLPERSSGYPLLANPASLSLESGRIPLIPSFAPLSRSATAPLSCAFVLLFLRIARQRLKAAPAPGPTTLFFYTSDLSYFANILSPVPLSCLTECEPAGLICFVTPKVRATVSEFVTYESSVLVFFSPTSPFSANRSQLTVQCFFHLYSPALQAWIWAWRTSFFCPFPARVLSTPLSSLFFCFFYRDSFSTLPRSKWVLQSFSFLYALFPLVASGSNPPLVSHRRNCRFLYPPFFVHPRSLASPSSSYFFCSIPTIRSILFPPH